MNTRLFSLFLALALALSLTACGGPSAPGNPQEGPGQAEGPAEPVDLSAFYAALTGGDEEWPAMMEAEAETLEAFYPGLEDIQTRQCLVQMAAITSVACEIALVEAEREEDVQTVKDIFQARIDYQVGDETNPGGAWYPETVAQWKENSRIVSSGNYVMLAVCEDAAGAEEQFLALFA